MENPIIAAAKDSEKRCNISPKEALQKIDPLLKVIFENSDIEHILIRGSTPAFNDGDLCLHNCVLAFDSAGLSYDFGIESEEELSDDSSLRKIISKKVFKKMFSLDIDKHLRDSVVVLLYEVDSYLQKIYNTNYQVLFSKSNGLSEYSFELTYEEYYEDY